MLKDQVTHTIYKEMHSFNLQLRQVWILLHYTDTILLERINNICSTNGYSDGRLLIYLCHSGGRRLSLHIYCAHCFHCLAPHAE